MSEIQFAPAEKAKLVAKITRYFHDELDQEIGRFEAEFLLDFFFKEIGVDFYNRGLSDAQAILTKKMEIITDAIYDLEKSTKAIR